MAQGGQVSAGGGRRDDDQPIEQTTGAGTQQVNVTGTDDLLDEIDGLLENLSLIHI